MVAANYLIFIGLGLVTIVLVLGLANMLRAGKPSRSQALMRWRVVLQFAVILLIVVIFALSRN